MKNTFIIQSTDESFKEQLYHFMSTYTDESVGYSAVYELNEEGTKKALEIINQ